MVAHKGVNDAVWIRGVSVFLYARRLCSGTGVAVDVGGYVTKIGLLARSKYSGIAGR